MSTPLKPTPRAVNGVLLLDKAVGVSSNTALQQVRRLYRAVKAGHTGVLDPLAGGLLPVCFGEAAKYAQYLLDADKAYTATLKLGEATTTGDAEGEVIATGPADISAAAFQGACAALIGQQHQVPPMFSALKHEGRPLYEYARKGITLERKAREITVFSINVLEFAPPVATITVSCSKGTYIRTLAEDIAKHLSTFAHLTALRRTATAGFSIENAYTYAQLQDMGEENRDTLLLPCDALVAHLPALTLDDADIRSLQCGRTICIKPMHTAQNHAIISPLRLYDHQAHFIGLGNQDAQTGTLKAQRLMSTASTH